MVIVVLLLVVAAVVVVLVTGWEELYPARTNAMSPLALGEVQLAPPFCEVRYSKPPNLFWSSALYWFA